MLGGGRLVVWQANRKSSLPLTRKLGVFSAHCRLPINNSITFAYA